MTRARHWSKQEVQYLPTFRRLYVEEQMSVDQIVDQEKVPVSKSTLYRWVKKHELDMERKQFMGGPDGIAQDLLQTIQDIVNEIRENRKITPGEADSVAKLVNSIEKLSAKVSYRRVALQILEFIIDYLQEQDPALLRKFTVHLGPLRERVKVKYGQ